MLLFILTQELVFLDEILIEMIKTFFEEFMPLNVLIWFDGGMCMSKWKNTATKYCKIKRIGLPNENLFHEQHS